MTREGCFYNAKSQYLAVPIQKPQNSKIRKWQVRMGKFLISSCVDSTEMEACDPVDL